MKLPWDEMEALVKASMNLKDKRVRVWSSLDTRRGQGISHDHHSATALAFTFEVQNVGIAFSGDRLMFVGPEAYFEIGLRNLASFSLEQKGIIEIVEQFEDKTERLTKFTVKPAENPS